MTTGVNGFLHACELASHFFSVVTTREEKDRRRGESSLFGKRWWSFLLRSTARRIEVFLTRRLRERNEVECLRVSSYSYSSFFFNWLQVVDCCKWLIFRITYYFLGIESWLLLLLIFMHIYISTSITEEMKPNTSPSRNLFHLVNIAIGILLPHFYVFLRIWIPYRCIKIMKILWISEM